VCTTFKVKAAKDGSVVVGRSLEFPTPLPTALAALPIGVACSGQAPPGAGAGASWAAVPGRGRDVRVLASRMVA
jgi:choloylglycine hydrolase